ncbi:MAG: hypothetical protein GXY15_15570 [Candidatus Hydrogenedentes bacterium]|nr:hypothetical protein [Candidatus Hydrogenedentota bacterium]
MRRTTPFLTVLAAALVLAAPAANAWGPRTQTAIVTTAAKLVSKAGNAPISKMDEHILAGVALPLSEITARHPEFATDPVSVIEQEMALLSAARRGRVDVYFAHRLGILGKMICAVTAPLAGAEVTWRNMYYADADNAIAGLRLKEFPRKEVDPKSYFVRLQGEMTLNSELIEKQYKDGVGFKDVAATTFPADASRSVAAVADVWWTVLTSRTVPGGVSEAQLQEYVLAAQDYLIQRGNLQELEAAVAAHRQLTPFTADMDARVGDMLLAAGYEDRAIAAYETVLAAAPDRKDVAKKVADYYVGKGNGLLQDGRLEDARDAFAAAAKANPLHPEAEAKRLEAEAQITARDGRQAAHRDALSRADELRAMAEQEAARSYYAEAISFLQQAEAAYQEVTDEFPSEAQQRTRGLRDVRDLLNQWKQSLKGSAPTYSGRGFTEDLNSAVQAGMKGLEQEALAEMADKAHAAEIERLTKEMQPQLAIP